MGTKSRQMSAREYEKSPISRASSMVAATDLTRYIKERLPLLFGIDVSIPRDHPPRTLPKAI